MPSNLKLNSPEGMSLRAIALPLEGDDVGDIGGEVTVLIALGLGGTGPAPVGGTGRSDSAVLGGVYVLFAYSTTIFSYSHSNFGVFCTAYAQAQ